MTFPDQLANWLERTLTDEIPINVKAFSFNLYEPAFVDDTQFGIELIGANEFDLSNSDWACEETWEAKPRGLNIPIVFSGETWEECLEKITVLILEELSKDTFVSRVLKSRQGIGVGFVDGDINVIWERNKLD
jgi:hypothetical protein